MQPRLPRRRGWPGAGLPSQGSPQHPCLVRAPGDGRIPPTPGLLDPVAGSASWPTGGRPKPGVPASCGRDPRSPRPYSAPFCAWWPTAVFPDPNVWLLLRHNPATDEFKCYLCPDPTPTPWTGWCNWPACAGRPPVLPGRQAALQAERLRGPQLAGLAPPRHARHAAPLLRGERDAAAPKKLPDLIVSQTCLLVDTILPRTGSSTDRAIAIVGYSRARNAAAHRTHTQHRRWYCEYLFRRHQGSLH